MTMIKIEGNDVSFEEEAHDNCELCGKKADLRPYGPNHERICIECGDKDPETTERMMNEALDQVLANNGLDLATAKFKNPNLSTEVLVIKIK